MFQLFRYKTDAGQEPFTKWLTTLSDKTIQAKVRVRLLRLEAGNLGDCKAVGEGVSELRIHIGAGYRVYFGQHGKKMILLLCGGDKSSQEKDINLAKQFWAKYKERRT